MPDADGASKRKGDGMINHMPTADKLRALDPAPTRADLIVIVGLAVILLGLLLSDWIWL